MTGNPPRGRDDGGSISFLANETLPTPISPRSVTPEEQQELLERQLNFYPIQQLKDHGIAFATRQQLDEIAKYIRAYRHKGLIEVCINGPKSVWVESRECGWQFFKDDKLDLHFLNLLARNLAYARGEMYHPVRQPFLFTTIPGCELRISLAGPAVVQSGFACSIRVPTAATYPVSGYYKESKCSHGDELGCYLDMSTEGGLKEALREGRNIVVAGGTNSGKTTFINSVLKYIPDDTRLIAIEDSPELRIPMANHIRLLKSKTGTDQAKVTYPHLINLCTRLRPDRIMLGELDTYNVAPFLRLINSGHGGCITSLHAESPELVHHTLVQNMQLAGDSGNMSAEDLLDYAKKLIQDVVYLSGNPRAGIRAEHVHFKYESDEASGEQAA